MEYDTNPFITRQLDRSAGRSDVFVGRERLLEVKASEFKWRLRGSKSSGEDIVLMNKVKSFGSLWVERQHQKG